VKAYSEQGVKTLFVINQETRQPFHNNPNWREPRHWSAYCQHLANTVGQIAAHYHSYGRNIVYQLWNEGGNACKPNQLSLSGICQIHERRYRQVSAKHAAQVPVLIWFAWSDNMRNAGMVKSDETPKPHLFDAFQKVRDRAIL